MKTRKTHRISGFGACLALSICASAQPFPANLVSNVMADNGTPYTAAQYRSIKFADVNGDGRPDLCYMDTLGINCALATQTDSNGQVKFDAPSQWTTLFNLTSAGDPSKWETIQYADVDGDGKADICGRLSSGVRCLKSSGYDFTEFFALTVARQFGDGFGFASDPSHWRTIRVVDVNGDGRADVCGRAPSGIVCQLYDPNGLIFAESTTVWSAQFSDANGWKNSPANWSTIQFVDLNNDRKADVCGRAFNGMVCALSSGTAFGTSYLAEPNFSDANYWNQEKYYSTIQFGDVNGDGRPDVCGRGTAGVYCGINWGNRAGQAIFSGSANLAAPAYSDANGWNVNYHYLDLWLTDVDGDGRKDVCGRGGSGIYCSRSTSSATSLQAQFASDILFVNNFGDIYNWQISESNWHTVQPVVSKLAGAKGSAFCGRGNAGIWCTDHH